MPYYLVIFIDPEDNHQKELKAREVSVKEVRQLERWIHAEQKSMITKKIFQILKVDRFTEFHL